MKKRLTVDFIMSNDPCTDYPESRVRELIGAGKTLLEVLDLDIPAPDRVWCMTRPDVLTHREQVQFAIYCARRALPRFESVYPGDDRPRTAISAALAWLKNPTESNQKRAENAAWSAARSAENAAWSVESAENAAWSAARSAENAAWSVVRPRLRFLFGFHLSSYESAENAAWSAARSAASAASAESAESAAWSAQINYLRKIIKARAKQ